MRRQRVTHVQHGGQGVNVAFHLSRRAPCLHYRVSHDHADHLADVLHGVLRKHRFVVREIAQHAVAGNVLRQDHAAYAGQGQRSRRLNAKEPAMRDRGQDGRGVQRSFELGHVVDVRGRALNLSAGAFMKARAACRLRHRRRADRSRLRVGLLGGMRVGRDDSGVGDFIAAGGNVFVHAHAFASRTNDSRLICCMPWLSSQ